MISENEFESLLPLACSWAEGKEREILRIGVPLSASAISDAMRIGVIHADQVRLLKVKQIPVPEHPMLRAAAEETDLISPFTVGLTLRYGIFIRSDCWNDRRLIFHELVHTMQFERAGGIRPFLERYLRECITIGYPDAPLEREAINTTARLFSVED